MPKMQLTFSCDADTRDMVVATMKDAVHPKTGLKPTLVELGLTGFGLERLTLEFADPELTTAELVNRWHADPTDRNQIDLLARLHRDGPAMHRGRSYRADVSYTPPVLSIR